MGDHLELKEIRTEGASGLYNQGAHMPQHQCMPQQYRGQSGHGDFSGFDNEAIDFRHLEDYINGDDDNNIYFPESLVGSEVKNPEPKNVSNVVHPQTQLTHSPNHLQYGVANTIPFKNGPIGNGYNHPHHLPDSPPDSGSEPPYSPPDEEQIPHTTGSSNLQDMLLPPMPGRKQMLSYTNTQPLKHMSDGQTPLQHLAIGMQQISAGPHHLAQHQITSQGNPSLAPLSVQISPQQMAAIPTDGIANPALVSPSLPSVFGSMVQRAPSYPSKKRKLSESPNGAANGEVLSNGIVHIKQEPGSGGVVLPPPPQSQRHCMSPDQCSNQSNSAPQLLDDDLAFDFSSDSGMAFTDSAYQCIRFHLFQQSSWHVMCDANLKELPTPNYRVDADKGFNFSNADEAFVCQKKNHFQVTVHAQLHAEPHYVKTPEGLKKIDSFYVHFYGCKVESPSQTIKVEQSQSDRSKKPFHPVPVDLSNDQMLKITVGRLHFSETTSNNMRKKGKPNPDQRYFYLVVGLHAHCGEHNYQIVSHASERIIVRASNPGQFESEVELSWQKGHTPDSIYHAGRVGVNTDRPDESLVVHGNVKVTGHIVQPSDVRAKEDIREVDTKEQLRNLQQLRIVRYHYNDDFAEHAGLEEDERSDTGVIAQEVQKVIPDAVKEAGDIVLPSGQRIDNFLVVNKERIFMENIGAVKELCKVTDNLGNRIDELERMNNKLAKLKRIDSLKSTSSGSTVTSLPSSSSCTKKPAPIRRRPRRMDNQGLCSNKFVQGTIIVLILVMAMCLIAMATLYILEWQKRQIYEFPTSTVPSTDSTAYPFNQTTMSWNSSETNKSSSSSQSSSPMSSFWGTTASSIAMKTPTVIHATSSSFTVRVLGKRDPIGVPSDCVGVRAQTNNCRSFCCSALDPPDSGEVVSPGQSGSSSNININIRQSNSKSTRRITVLPTVQTTASTSRTTPTPATTSTRQSSVVVTPSSFRSTNNHVNIQSYEVEHSTQDNRLPDTENESSHDHYPMVSRVHKPFPFMKARPGNPEKTHRRKRDSSNTNGNNRQSTISKLDFASMVRSIQLVEFNHTITPEYCSNCREGNFTYFIPVSRYMTQQTLTLEFRLSSASSIYVDYCQTGNKITECSHLYSQGSQDAVLPNEATNERKTEEMTPSWILPIGKFVESSYKFRVTSIPNHLDACTAGREFANITFIEYNFVFYRTCSE